MAEEAEAKRIAEELFRKAEEERIQKEKEAEEERIRLEEEVTFSKVLILIRGDYKRRLMSKLD